MFGNERIIVIANFSAEDERLPDDLSDLVDLGEFILSTYWNKISVLQPVAVSVFLTKNL